MNELTAERGRFRIALAASILVAAGVVWAVRHVMSTIAAFDGVTHQFGMVYSLAFLVLVWQMVLCGLERPYIVRSARQQRALDVLRVVINVPVYNEDPQLLAYCLKSLGDQTRKPQHIHVVDDGSKVDYSEVRVWAEDQAARVGIKLTWSRTSNRGKRHAQGMTVKTTPEADIYFTVDSDSILDRKALEEGIKPFADRRVMSVAGVVLTANHNKSFLARMANLWFVVGQLVDRSALSTMGSVIVNSGPIALYRAEVIRDNLDSYLNETFMGRGVEFSDDSMLTIFALMRGKAVQQPTAFAFSAMPESTSHHLRQYMRWMRGAFIRTWWRFRYLPLTGYAFWAHFMGWVQMMVATAIFFTLFFVQPVMHAEFTPMLLLIPLLVGYGQALRYFTIKRSDESLGEQLITFLLSPIASLWAFFVLRFVRWYAMATCLKTGWGTRTEVEVSMS